MTWQLSASCNQVGDPELWFPGSGGSTLTPRKICLQCPVRCECLRDAIDRRERHGIFGGFSERDRNELTLRRNPIKLRDMQ